MSARLVVDVKEVDEVSFVKLSGIIDEDNELTEITNRITKKVVVINTADLDRINSCGVRDWVTWHGELQKCGAAIYLVECSPAIMTQVNLVNNFVGSSTIVNFYAPYFCSACDTDKMLLIDVEKALQSTPFRAPVCRCDKCDKTMEFDDIESSYFAFLPMSKGRVIDSALQTSINRFATHTGKLRARTPSLSMPSLPSMTPSTPSANAPTMTPTTPRTRELRSLLTDPGPRFTPPVQPTASRRILYLIVGLLVVAIALLGYVVLRSVVT